MTSLIDFSASKTILSVTTVCFDIFVLECLLPLTQGMQVVLTSEIQQKDPAELFKLIDQYKVDMLQTTPSRMKMMLQEKTLLPVLGQLSEIMLGGEVFARELLGPIQQYSNAKIYNLYGPTETTVWSTVKEVKDQGSLNIGKPIANTQIYVLDSEQNPVPRGIVGELTISGKGLAKGYLNQPELTEQKFITNPSLQNLRMYRTGDLARWTPEGDLQFLGRLDWQMKIRGFRIEPKEIENALLKYGPLKSAAVSAVEFEKGNLELAAYYVSEQKINVTELRVFLMKILPDYMVPAYYFPLDTIPLTVNGKIDRKSLNLLKLNNNFCRVEYIAPQNELEKKLAVIWKEVLGVEKIGTHDNFFNLGGNSIKAISMVSLIKNELGMELPLQPLFQYPTIQQIAVHMEKKKK